MNWIQSTISKRKAGLCKQRISAMLLLCIFLTTISGCITVGFEPHVGTENNVEIKFETPVSSKETTTITSTAIFTATRPIPSALVVPAVTQQGAPGPTSQVPQFIESITIPSDTNAGIIYTAPQSGTYIFQYSDSTSVVWNGVRWVTEVLAFRGAVPQWGNGVSLNYDTALFKIGGHEYTTKQSAIDSTKGKRGMIQLNIGELITLVVSDGRPWYVDNTGEIVLDVYALLSASSATKVPPPTPVTEDGVLRFSDEFREVSYGWNKFGNVEVKDDQIEISERPSSSSGISLQSGISEGMGMLVLFKFTRGVFDVYLADKSVNWKTYVGLKTDYSFRLITSVGKNEKFIGGQSLDGNLLISPDRWYFVMIKILKGGAFYIRIWEKDNPANYREAGVRLETELENQSWYPAITVTTGQVAIDFYQELEFK
jgi:hypothetical protein